MDTNTNTRLVALWTVIGQRQAIAVNCYPDHNIMWPIWSFSEYKTFEMTNTIEQKIKMVWW